MRLDFSNQIEFVMCDNHHSSSSTFPFELSIYPQSSRIFQLRRVQIPELRKTAHL
uniref:Uncharacterized protein n=1 Tax=Rhizophora mucronata TaxID=61149 RepID=A0A2P2R2V7_RHIMU